MSDREGGDWEGLFDPSSHEGQIGQFVTTWAEAQGGRLPREQVEHLQRRLEQFPSYFAQQLAYYTVAEPLFAKVVIARLELLPPGSALTRDPELRSELDRKCSVVLGAEERRRLGDELISNFEWAGAVFFPGTFQPLGAQEKTDFHRRIEDLPPLVLKTLTKGGMRPAQLLLLLHGFGLSPLGIPERAQTPTQP